MAKAKSKKQIQFRSADAVAETLKATIEAEDFDSFEIEFKRPSTATKIQMSMVFGSEDKAMIGQLVLDVLKACLIGWSLSEDYTVDAIDRMEDTEILLTMFTKIAESMTAGKN